VEPTPAPLSPSATRPTRRRGRPSEVAQAAKKAATKKAAAKAAAKAVAASKAAAKAARAQSKANASKPPKKSKKGKKAAAEAAAAAAAADPTAASGAPSADVLTFMLSSLTSLQSEVKSLRSEKKVRKKTAAAPHASKKQLDKLKAENKALKAEVGRAVLLQWRCCFDVVFGVLVGEGLFASICCMYWRSVSLIPET
jgi:hypothetical protein